MNKTENVIYIPRILLPVDNGEEAMRAWSVIACDQFTSDRAYWDTLDREIGDKPSSLRLIFPEAFLKDADSEQRVKNINRTMLSYERKGVFKKMPHGFILTERSTRYTKEKRYGIVLAVDLERYSFAPRSEAAIRATEETVPERIPPRVKIRQGASLELPHVMLLYDVREKEIIGDELDNLSSIEKLYDFELNQGGGHLRGWFLDEARSKKIAERLYETAGNMLFAVGDGNHSLATAKTCWENIKKNLSEEEKETHLARYALCEAVSIYSPALTFEPIHRFVAGVDAKKFISCFKHKVTLPVVREGRLLTFIGNYDVVQAIREIDAAIAEYIKTEGGDVDYIHGNEELCSLTEASSDCVGVKLKEISKDGFFKAVQAGGSLPRKTFSMGEGAEKRYYTECKEI